MNNAIKSMNWEKQSAPNWGHYYSLERYVERMKVKIEEDKRNYNAKFKRKKKGE